MDKVFGKDVNIPAAKAAEMILFKASGFKTAIFDEHDDETFTTMNHGTYHLLGRGDGMVMEHINKRMPEDDQIELLKAVVTHPHVMAKLYTHDTPLTKVKAEFDEQAKRYGIKDVAGVYGYSDGVQLYVAGDHVGKSLANVSEKDRFTFGCVVVREVCNIDVNAMLERYEKRIQRKKAKQEKQATQNQEKVNEKRV